MVAKSGSAKILSSGGSSASRLSEAPFPMPCPRMAACTFTPSDGPAIVPSAEQRAGRTTQRRRVLNAYKTYSVQKVLRHLSYYYYYYSGTH